MILFPLITLWIWLQVFMSAPLLKQKPALIPGARLKAEQGRPDDGNLIQ